MASTKYITSPGILRNVIEHKGNNTDTEIGIVINLPNPTDVLEVPAIISRYSRSPLQIRQGIVVMRDYTPDNTYGDSITFHENSQLAIDNFELSNPDYRISDNPEWRKNYHVDRLIQGYSLSGCAHVGNVIMKNIFMHTRGEEDQGVMLSEANDFYHDWELGTESLDIDMQYEWLLRCTNVTRLKMGGGNTKLKGLNGNAPAIRIGSKENPIKETPYHSLEIELAEELQNPRNVVPFFEDQRLFAKAQELGIKSRDLSRLLT